MKVMISQPMNGRSSEDILNERQSLTQKFNDLGIEVLNTYFQEQAPEGCDQRYIFFR